MLCIWPKTCIHNRLPVMQIRLWCSQWGIVDLRCLHGVSPRSSLGSHIDHRTFNPYVSTSCPQLSLILGSALTSTPSPASTLTSEFAPRLPVHTAHLYLPPLSYMAQMKLCFIVQLKNALLLITESMADTREEV